MIDELLKIAFFYMAVAAATVLFGFVCAVAASAIVLRWSRQMQLFQRAYEDAPASHQSKTGTPTMGGFAFLVAMLPLVVLAVSGSLAPGPLASVRALVFLVFACAAIGIIDDYLAVRLGRNRGLRARTKYLATALVAVMFLRMVISDVDPSYLGHTIFAVGAYALQVPLWLWLVLGTVAITGTVHAVNLTDGLDGLAAGSIIGPLFVLGFVSLQFGMVVATLASMLTIGACLGFLVYNRYPAKLIMGDTGSLALGALLSGIAILSGEMLLLVVIGFVFVAEALSVMLQVVYFKLTRGKRIFKMSPLHHHFELSGWPETKVTTRFWIASAICSAVGLAIVR